MIEKSLSFYRKKAKKLDFKNSNHKKLALLSNFTLQGFSDVLKVISNDHGMNLRIYESPYDQYRQEIINENSEWRKFNPDISFIVLDFESLVGSVLFDYPFFTNEEKNELIEKTCFELTKFVKSALKQKGLVIISTFLLPEFSPLGIYELKTQYSMREFVTKLNNLLLELSTQYGSLFCFEMDTLFQKYGSENFVDYKLKYLADMKISPDKFEYLAYLMLSFLFPLFGKTKKCLVLDLDNTLWGGIVGEDGLNNIKIDSKITGSSFLEFQKVILQLFKRGIILAVNSKNNLSDVIDVFQNHPDMILKENYFAAMRVNWNDKASNMSSIADELNIGLDSIVFWDDDPVNRELIKQKLSDVFVVDVPKDYSIYAKTLRNLPFFNSFTLTDEDMKKGQMYASQKQRKTFENNFTNMDDFLSSLEMEVIHQDANEFTIPRISQLVMKTNQFNLTSKRYSENEIRKMAHNKIDYVIRTFSINDKFGDNGLTGLYIINKFSQKQWIIDSFLLSCRVMGRNIENTMLNDILELAKKENVDEIIGEYIPSVKNSVTKDLYVQYGFEIFSDTKFILKDISNFTLKPISYIKSSKN
jgi:FkbH-like protein